MDDLQIQYGMRNHSILVHYYFFRSYSAHICSSAVLISLL